jgi:hypothetical protein
MQVPKSVLALIAVAISSQDIEHGRKTVIPPANA